MNLSAFISTVELGLVLSVLALGLFISFKILNTADLTVDGSFVTGMCVAAAFTSRNHYIAALFMALAAGFVAGALTGVIHTKLHVHPILSGIIVMTGLYSINIRVLDHRPNLALYQYTTIFSKGRPIFTILVIVSLITALLYFFLRTQIGLSLRATGDNEAMVRNSSINTDLIKIMGLGLANALVALSGGILAQYQSLADVNSGTGMLVIGIASIILGEALFKRKGLLHDLICVVIGSILYRTVVYFALSAGLSGSDLKLFSSIILVAALLIPEIRRKK